MAASTTSPSSPLRPEDLLSDSSEPPGLSQVSSEVTSQLYASLRLSRQAEATARAQLYLPATSPPDHEVLDGLAQELSRSLSLGLENNLKKKDGSKHIFEMESVRGQLQTMLQTSRDAACRDPPTPGGGSERREEDSFDSDSTGTLLNSAQALEELFPRYTSLRPGPPLHPPDLPGLREALDAEHTRRKHCERHIQSLQTRVLELQQQLAVAVAADRKKDIMIEQLDKTLARVVEGWNRHEAERTEVLRGLQEERQAAELTRSKQQETVARLEQSLSEAMEALNREQESARLQQRERETLEEERQALTLSLEVEQQRCHTLQEERDEARAGQLSDRRQLETLQVALEEERRSWAQQEHQLKERYQALQEESQAQLEKEKGNSWREAQAAQEAQQQLALVQSEVQRLEGELDTARRERDALQLEMSLVQEEERQALTLSLEVEQQRCHTLQEERDEARAGQLSDRRQLETLQVALEEERRSWAQQEHQLKERYQALQEESQAQLEKEKGNSWREAQAAQEAQQQLALVQSEVQRLEGELDTARRERDALQLEMSLVQARYESQRIQMESELAVQLEQRVTERLGQGQESSLRQAASLREHHRKQLQDLSGQHQQELAAQLAQFKVEMAEREERQQQVTQDYELRLAREQARVRELQSGSQQLEEQRVELVERLQAMLQAHWDEANQLLNATLPPPNPAVPPIGPSSLGPLEPEKEERKIWAMPPVAVALKPVLQQSREARDELPGGPPDLCGSSPDLSLLLGPTFQSQHSFQPLEPKPDLTPPTAEAFSSALGTFHPDHRAERPFPEEGPGSDGDGFLKQGLPPASQLEGLKNFLHQLLETVPQNNENPSVDLLPPKSGADGQPREVSQLLRLYQARGWGALPAEDLLLYLKRLEHSGSDGRGDNNVPRRNIDSRLGEIPRKEIPSQAVPRRFATAPKPEKPPARKKSGHPAPSSIRNRGGIWR
ncbi:Centrobin [Tupaia chinensis]|uniref:Centrobin n=1 Tax=Tupaia chinensis TaxID=246437 RepID=L9KLH6_TUPCH|nr:Centrobin [Tupaia chinensis]